MKSSMPASIQRSLSSAKALAVIAKIGVWRPRIVAESRLLGVPVQLAGAFGIGFEAMLGPRVVGADGFL